MPLGCRHYRTCEIYDYRKPEHRKRWNELKEDAPEGSLEDLLKAGWSAWIVPETGEPWIPTDVHSETTHNALLRLGYNCHDKYKGYAHSELPPIDAFTFKEYWRKKGKTFNFMRNYGGGKYKAMETLEVTEEVAEALVTGWSDSFPEVAFYQNAVIDRVREQGYATNMYGRRYYLSNTDKAYKVGNYLVQGSCADMFKEKMIAVDRFLQENGCKSFLFANIHDAIKIAVYDGEEWILPKIREIMSTVDWMLVPVECGCDVYETNWAEKYEWQEEKTPAH